MGCLLNSTICNPSPGRRCIQWPVLQIQYSPHTKGLSCSPPTLAKRRCACNAMLPSAAACSHVAISCSAQPNKMMTFATMRLSATLLLHRDNLLRTDTKTVHSPIYKTALLSCTGVLPKPLSPWKHTPQHAESNQLPCTQLPLHTKQTCCPSQP